MNDRLVDGLLQSWEAGLFSKIKKRFTDLPFLHFEETN